MSGRTVPQGKALALMAYALDMGGENAVAIEAIDALADELCVDGVERTRLISGLSSSCDPEIRLQVLEILGRRLGRLRDVLEGEIAEDEVIGVWSQRIAGGAILAGIGLVASGVAAGGWGFAVILGPLLAAALATSGRISMKARASKARRACEETDRLTEIIKETKAL